MSTPRAAVPLYIHPVADSELWEQVLRPGAADLVVVNVDSGPGRELDPVFADALRAQDPGAPTVILGYVDTDYGRRSVRDVRAEARRWREDYGVTSIFLDQVISGTGAAGRIDIDALLDLTHLVDALRSDGVVTIAGNPGTVPHPRITRILDVTCVRETDLRTHLTAPDPPIPDVDPARLWHLIYDCPPDRVQEAVTRSVALGAGLVGLAADGLPHPWGSVGYLNSGERPVSRTG